MMNFIISLLLGIGVLLFSKLVCHDTDVETVLVFVFCIYVNQVRKIFK